MKKIYFKATKEQRNALEGLSYRIADSAYMRERFGNDEPELKQNKKKRFLDCLTCWIGWACRFGFRIASFVFLKIGENIYNLGFPNR